jgi:choline dehydrogenase-like flavoprotein
MLLTHTAELTGGEHAPRTVVVGAGAVGLYLASELVGRGHDVVVVESGGVVLDSFDPESYRSVGRKHEGIRIGRSRSLGGTTNLWGGQLAEFQPVDFVGRGWMGGSRWPLSYDEITPYYTRTYENLGIVGDIQEDDHVWASLLTSRPELGEGLEPFLTRWLPIPSFSVLNADLINKSRRLAVLIGHTAVGFRSDGERIAAIRVVDPDGRAHMIEGERFVLAAGTIETVRLLLHCAATPGSHTPWRENKFVGTHFQDHLGGRVATVRPVDHQVFFKTFCNILLAGHKYQPKLRFANETLESDRLLNTQGQFVFESSVSENLVYLKQFVRAAIYSRQIAGIRDLVANLRACSKYLVPIMWAYIRDHRIFEPRSSKVSLIALTEQVPLAASSITIDSTTKDAYGLPRVVLDWRISGEELASLREFALRADRALRAAGLARLEIDDDLLDLDPGFMVKLRDTNHQAGGAIMAASASEGVVDRDLRVFGTSNLYVAGAATFPTIGSANTTFTALAFATRLADHLTAHATT